MSLASAWAVALHGVDGMLVEIEVDIGPGLPGLHMVGLPDAALSEARDRVRAAVLNSGERRPSRRMTLALSSATLPKGGSSYDVALPGEPRRRHRPLPDWSWSGWSRPATAGLSAGAFQLLASPVNRSVTCAPDPAPRLDPLSAACRCWTDGGCTLTWYRGTVAAR